MSEWIEHDGSGVPVPRGTLVQVKRDNGDVSDVFPADSRTIDIFGEISPYNDALPSNWVWMEGDCWPMRIIAYRLHDNGEQAKREARIASLRKMAQPNDYDVRPVKAPEREKVKQ